MRLLIIEDELPMRTALAQTMTAAGYHVRTATDGEEGLELACREPFDLLLLDVMMPGLDGYEVCRNLRQRGREMPILMLTAKGMVDDRVEGLECGADDYLVKPFSLRELTARVRALLRRHERTGKVPERVEIGEAVVDFAACALTRDGVTITLPTKEVGMLRLFVARRGEVISRETFLDVVWGYHAFPSNRTVDNYVASLRQRIESDPSRPVFFLTIRGEGYRLVPERESGR